MSAPSSLDFTIERRAGIDVVVFANDSCRPAMETELAMWSRLASSPKPITHVVVADTAEFGTVACGYSGSSDEIARAVMAKACAQGYSGSYQDRLAELGWRVEPVYLAVPPEAQTFQEGVSDWMAQCFVPSLYSNMTERGDRLLEEVLELLQAHGYDPSRVATLVDYVFNRPVGQPAQEVGGVMVTLAGYCWVAGLDMHAAGDTELVRITQPEVMAKIRAKQEAKNALHFDTPLPGNTPAAPGIDLGKLQRYRMASNYQDDIRTLHKDDTGTWVKIQDVERALIDASHKERAFLQTVEGLELDAPMDEVVQTTSGGDAVDHAGAALAHLSNALDDLQYSPDQRPVPLIREAMWHVQQLQRVQATCAEAGR